LAPFYKYAFLVTVTRHFFPGEGNPIPLPPRDRSRPLAAKPRHQRKHPLIFPCGGVPRTLAMATLADGSHADPGRFWLISRSLVFVSAHPATMMLSMMLSKQALVWPLATRWRCSHKHKTPPCFMLILAAPSGGERLM